MCRLGRGIPNNNESMKGQSRPRKRIVRKCDETVEDIEEAAGELNDGYTNRHGVSTGDLSQYVDSCRRSWWWLILGCAIILAIVAVVAELVPFNYPRAQPVAVHLIADAEMKEFETFLNKLASISHEDSMKAVVRIPVVLHQTRVKLDNAAGVLRSDFPRDEWQEVMVKDIEQINQLFRETAEEMCDYLLQGKDMMMYMADLGLPRIGKAFEDGNYSIVLEVLEDMERHITDADASITTARGKLRGGIEGAENVLESVQKKMHALIKDAKEADKGWNTETKLAVYGIAMALTVVTGAVAVPLIGVGAGLTAAGGTAVVGGGGTIMKHWLDIVEGAELKQQLELDAHKLEGAYDDMTVVRDNLEMVSLHIRQLRVAVDDAEKSVSGLYGQLNPTKATRFYSRLKELSLRCSELHTLYKRGIADYRAEDWQQQEQGPHIDWE